MAAATQVDTLIFVDVDGVLNVGIHDGDQAPLLLNEDNRMYATSRGKHWRCSAEEKQCIQKVLAVVEKQLEDGNGETFASLTCDPGKQCSSVLVRRLAQIIASSGERRSVILASNWRKPKYASRVRRLEAEISRQLGKPFTFDARTRPAEETSAADRLQCIGDFVQSHFTGPAAAAAAGAAARVGPLRVLVLDDFFITPLDGWSCGGTEVCSTRDAEAYLRGRAPAAADVAVRLLHPYAEWAGPRGLQLQVGAGLSARHCGEALAFLGAAAEGAEEGVGAPSPREGEGEARREGEEESGEAAGGAASPPKPAPTKAEGARQPEGVTSIAPELACKSNTLADAVDSTMMASLVGVCFSGCMTAVPWLCIHL